MTSHGEFTYFLNRLAGNSGLPPGRALTAVIGEWTVYAPTLTASVTNPNLGSGGVNVGYYKTLGGVVHFAAAIRFGAGPDAGSGVYRISLPIPAHGTHFTIEGGNHHVVGSGLVTDDSAGVNTIVAVRFASTTTVDLPVNGGGVVSNSTLTWAQGDFIRISGTYEPVAIS